MNQDEISSGYQVSLSLCGWRLLSCKRPIPSELDACHFEQLPFGCTKLSFHEHCAITPQVAMEGI